MHDIVHMTLGYLWNALLLSLQQVFVLVGPGLLFAFMMNYLGGFVQKRSYSLMGRKIYLGLFGWLGTMVHELGHAAFCVLFRHRINEMKLFSLNSKSGKLGYVNHSYNPNSIYQLIGNFFIGIGPILFGSIAIYGLSRFLLRPDILQSIETLQIQSADTDVWVYCFQALTSVGSGVRSLGVGLFTEESLKDWRLYLFLYIVFCIGSSITLSPADIKGAWRGLAAFIGILFLLNLVTHWIIGSDLTKAFRSLTQYYSVFYTTMLFAIVLNVMASFILLMSSIVSRAGAVVSVNL